MDGILYILYVEKTTFKKTTFKKSLAKQLLFSEAYEKWFGSTF